MKMEHSHDKHADVRESNTPGRTTVQVEKAVQPSTIDKVMYKSKAKGVDSKVRHPDTKASPFELDSIERKIDQQQHCIYPMHSYSFEHQLWRPCPAFRHEEGPVSRIEVQSTDQRHLEHDGGRTPKLHGDHEAMQQTESADLEKANGSLSPHFPPRPPPVPLSFYFNLATIPASFCVQLSRFSPLYFRLLPSVTV